jgi:hypothetical protein
MRISWAPDIVVRRSWRAAFASEARKQPPAATQPGPGGGAGREHWQRLPITHFAGFEPGKTLHQIKGRVIDVDTANCRSAFLPRPPAPGAPARRCLKASVYLTMHGFDEQMFGAK